MPIGDATLSSSLDRNPGLDRWVEVSPDGFIIVRTGKAELGQGIRTAIAAIAADELGVRLDQVRMEGPATGRAPNEMITAGSASIQTSGMAVRQACAVARGILLSRAAAELRTAVESLTVSDGQVTVPDGRSMTYWALPSGSFECDIKAAVAPLPPEARRHVGHPLRRLDLAAKIRGESAFVQDLRLPGMRFARVLRPPWPGARLTGDLPAVGDACELVRVGSFVAVVADRECDAVRVAQSLAGELTWAGGDVLPTDGDRPDYLRGHVESSSAIIDGVATEGPLPPVPSTRHGRTVAAQFSKPFIMHGAIGPSAAVAQFDGGQLSVWSHSQGVELLRPALAAALELDLYSVHVTHRDGAGCYGHNGADDAAMDAALIAMSLPGRPVLVQWTRTDEHRWEPLGPAMAVDVAAEISPAGRIASWQHDIYTYPHVGRPFRDQPGKSNLLATWYLDPPSVPVIRRSTGFHGGGHRNADPLYDVGERRIIKHEVGNAPLRTSSTRSLGAFVNVFAIESLMDEIAESVGTDPVSFRLAHLADERARAVIETVTELAGGLATPGPGDTRGRGLAFAQYENSKAYAAVIVEIEVNAYSGVVSLRHGWIAADAGEVIDRDGLVNQLEGGFIQSASWTLKERVGFDQGGVTTTDWESYPILTFSEVPELTTRVIDRPEEPPLGAGECATGPTAAAIGNAFAQVTGLRVRDLPLSPERVAALARAVELS